LRFKIYINPVSGKKKGEKIYRKGVEPLLQAAGCAIHRTVQDGNTNYTHVVTTTGPGFATQDAAQIPVANFDAIMCVGGDGLIHEVINGLANRDDGSHALRRLAIAVIPAGMML
jgi:sphingosine kinase